MDNRVLGGLTIVCVLIVVVAGIIIYNTHPSKSEVNNTQVNDLNKSNNYSYNNTTQTPLVTLPLTLLYQSRLPSYNSNSSVSIPSNKTDSKSNLDNILQLFDAYVNSTYPQTGVPGAAIVIVHNNKIIYLNCLGVRNVATGAPITPNTLFQLASDTKAFTATNLAQQVDKGVMNWNDLITKYYPNPKEFKLYSNMVTNEVTLKDVLCQRVGLYEHSGDEFQLFNYTDYDKNLYKFRYFKNASKFRTTFSYNNILYALSGESAARAAKTPWSKLITKELLLPLDMKNTVTTYYDFMHSPNRIHTYYHIGNALKERVPMNTDSPPSGIISLPITDIAKWLIFQIRDDGTYNGKRIVSKKNLDMTRTGWIKQNSMSMYGFGWNVAKDMISHTGSMFYSNSVVTIYLKEKIGISIFTNEGTYGTAFITALNLKLNDLLHGKSSDPWPQWKKDLMPPVRLPNAPSHLTPAKILNTYTGVYSNSIFGKITVIKKKNTLFCYYGNNQQPFDLTHWNGDVFMENNYDQAFNFTNINHGSAHKLTTNITDYSNASFPQAVFRKRL